LGVADRQPGDVGDQVARSGADHGRAFVGAGAGRANVACGRRRRNPPGRRGIDRRGAAPMLAAMPHDPATLPTITLQPGREKRVLAGHPWVFSNEVRMDEAARAVPPGALVRLVTAKGTPVGIAGFNRHALIAGRLLTRAPDAAIDSGFIADRLARARALRDRLFDRPHYRLAFAEADGLPALIVDRYDDVVVVQ